MGLVADKLGGGPVDGKQSLRIWLRLLTCTALIERDVSNRFREEFDTTLPRFDYLSALDRAGEAGLSLGEVSRMLMVSNGNVTGLTARLKEDGLIEHLPSADRRQQKVRLTSEGQRRFRAMATAHEGWIERLFAELTEGEGQELLGLLDRTKRSLTHDDRPEG